MVMGLVMFTQLGRVVIGKHVAWHGGGLPSSGCRDSVCTETFPALILILDYRTLRTVPGGKLPRPHFFFYFCLRSTCSRE